MISKTPEVLFTGTRPTRAHATDAGADLYAAETIVIPSGEQVAIKTGTAVRLPEGAVGIIAGRSGLARDHRVRLSNGVGVIDSGYTGELTVLLTNDGRKPYIVQAEDRIAQLLVMPALFPQFWQVDNLGNTDRGANGFGSTGRG